MLFNRWYNKEGNQMRISNNRIYIVRGETPTYDAEVIDKDSGAPYIIVSEIQNPWIEFIVRPSIYGREDDYAFRVFLDYTKYKKFPTTEVVEYPNDVWSNEYVPSDDDKDKLFYKKVTGGKEYRYYNPDATGSAGDSKWMPYSFRITFQFPYYATSEMESKPYRYEISLYGGTPKDNPDEDEIPINVTYKAPIMPANDFIVEGSISE